MLCHQFLHPPIPDCFQLRILLKMKKKNRSKRSAKEKKKTSRKKIKTITIDRNRRRKEVERVLARAYDRRSIDRSIGERRCNEQVWVCLHLGLIFHINTTYVRTPIPLLDGQDSTMSERVNKYFIRDITVNNR